MVSHPWNEYSFAEYVDFEKRQDGKHEFVDGEIVAMAGGTAQHAALGAELVGQLRAQLAGSGRCRVFSSDLWLGSLETAMTTYADASVVCGGLQTHPEEPNIVVNPRIVGEVTSKSSERKDRGAKLAHYQRMPSIEAIIIVSHREQRIDVHRRVAAGEWTVTTASAGTLPVIDAITLDVDALYRSAEGL